MFRYLERAENTARLLEAGWRIALTRSPDSENDGVPIVSTAGMNVDYEGESRHLYSGAGHQFSAAGQGQPIQRDEHN